MNISNSLADYYFHEGTNFNAYEYLGCILTKLDGKYVYTFRTWAPNAKKVELISEFNGWDNPIPMEKINDGGVWELKYSSNVSLEKQAYKFRIHSDSGIVNKGDPYARFSKGLDDGASLIFTSNSFKWSDGRWMNHRSRVIGKNVKDAFLATPINIYEMHLGSFMRHDDNTFLSYRELADILPQYVKAMGYTHIELLPIMEHPFGGSWGYQVGAFYAPTSRFGDPDDFRFLINALHKSGIGVIMDWVPAHFPKDQWGLYEFDGKPLYEYQGVDRIESRSWGTRFFDLGREEIQSFLVSNALYYLREFHIDGLRVDAVASMIYLDYDREQNEWIPNVNGTNINLEAVAFLQKLNATIFAEFPDVLMIAEESGSHGGITRPVDLDGLGFSMKWNMGWANDFYKYVSTDPVFRKYNHKALNFPIMYAFSENYCLPISHDEVVHGKKSFIDKMYGSYEDKFAQMRTSLLLMMTYPGKKLMFMGTEYGQFREWDYDNSLEWFMLDYPAHKYMRDYVRELNLFYLKSRPLWELDFSPNGFSWILADEAEKNLVAYRRIDLDGNSFVVIINFSGSVQNVEIPVLKCKNIEVTFATDYVTNQNIVPFRKGSDYFININIPRFYGMVLVEKNGTKKIKI